MPFSKPEAESVVVTFYTTAEAFAFEKACRGKGIEGRLVAVPRRLSAGCGMAWASPARLRSEIERLAEAEALAYEGVHAVRL